MLEQKTQQGAMNYMKNLSDVMEANVAMTVTAKVIKAVSEGKTNSNDIALAIKYPAKSVSATLCNLTRRGVLIRDITPRKKGSCVTTSFRLAKPLDQITVKEMVFDKQQKAKNAVRSPRVLKRELKVQFGATSLHSSRIRSVLSGVLDDSPVCKTVQGGFTASWNISDPSKEQNAKSAIQLLKSMNLPVNAMIEAEKVIPRHTETVTERL